MTNERYKPSMEPKVKDGVITVSGAYIDKLGLLYLKSKGVCDVLEKSLVGQVICPRLYYFKDSEDVRKLLKMKE